MVAQNYPDMTSEALDRLLNVHGTWKAVARHLEISQTGLNAIRVRTGNTTTPDRARRRKRPSSLDPYKEYIRILSEDVGLDTGEIVDVLGLTLDKEQVRRFCHNNQIRLALPQGGPTGAKNGSWQGGFHFDHGYLCKQVPDHPYTSHSGYVREHRLVMEQSLGRYLLPEEVVHHRNGNILDNRIENLQLFANNAEHLRETLKGQIPNWTPEGLERIQQGVQKSIARRAVSSPAPSERRDPASS